MKLVIYDLGYCDTIKDPASLRGGAPKAVRALPKIVKSTKRTATTAPAWFAFGMPTGHEAVIDETF